MKLDARHKQAAERLADGKWTDQRIATEAGVTRGMVWKWTQDPAFAALLAEYKERLHGGIIKRGIADKQTRIDGYVDRHQRLQHVIEARAERGQREIDQNTGLTKSGLPEPGGKKHIPDEVVTGMVVHQQKPTQFGFIDEWVVDNGTSAEMRALEKQIAQELGEWTERRELTGKDGGPVALATRVDLRSLPDAELEVLRNVLARAAGDSVDSGGS